jgi:hypothetical protein
VGVIRMWTLIKVCMAGVHKKFKFLQSMQFGNQSVIRNADFRESPRELPPKYALFLCFEFGGSLRPRAARVASSEVRRADHPHPVVENATDEKPEACEVSSPYQL